MKKKKIKKAAAHNKVWCTNKEFAPDIAPCYHTKCKFKNEEERQGKPKELKDCKSWWITFPSKHFHHAVTVLIHPKVDKHNAPEVVIPVAGE